MGRRKAITAAVLGITWRQVLITQPVFGEFRRASPRLLSLLDLAPAKRKRQDCASDARILGLSSALGAKDLNRTGEAMDISTSTAWAGKRTVSRRCVAHFLLLIVSFFLWQLSLFIQGGHPSILSHNPYDQHTRQAQAWLHGRMTIDYAPAYLEIASFEGRSFNSFPPTPSLFELPLILLFGDATPSYLMLYMFASLALISLYDLGVKMRLRSSRAAALSVCLIFGTNVLVSVATGGVWAQGQIYGFCLAIFALRWISPRPALAYLALSLAVGCRPFYFFYFPLLIVLDYQWSKRHPGRIIRTAVLSFFPYVAAMALYNWARFHNPAEFGHTYLPWSRQLKNGVFSLAYLPGNFFHTFINLPTFGGKTHFLEFHGRGTAFVLNNPIVALGIAGLSSPFVKKEVRSAAVLVLAIVGFCLLLHESNGWYQFGLRYCIDIAPIAAIGAIAAFRSLRHDATIIGLTLFSVGINFYGIWWLSLQ